MIMVSGSSANPMRKTSRMTIKNGSGKQLKLKKQMKVKNILERKIFISAIGSIFTMVRRVTDFFVLHELLDPNEIICG